MKLKLEQCRYIHVALTTCSSYRVKHNSKINRILWNSREKTPTSWTMKFSLFLSHLSLWARHTLERFQDFSSHVLFLHDLTLSTQNTLETAINNTIFTPGGARLCTYPPQITGELIRHDSDLAPWSTNKNLN